jgi:menaquinone-dependent protoporphyrinogen IX oxidase
MARVLILYGTTDGHTAKIAAALNGRPSAFISVCLSVLEKRPATVHAGHHYRRRGRYIQGSSPLGP